MKIEGDAAKTYDAIRRDSYMVVNKGPLTFADTDTGQVKWKTTHGDEMELKLEPYNLTLLPKSRYGRST